MTAYFLLFTIQFIAGVSLIVWYEIALVTGDTAAETIVKVLGRAGTIPILSASTSYIFAEGGRLTMVISNWVERKLEDRRIKREQAILAEGFEKGRAYERSKIAAEAKVEDFDDPPSPNDKQ